MLKARGSNDAIADNSLTAVVRIGNDFQGNYYEVRIPLKKTNWGETDSLRIWPEANNLDFDLEELTRLKSRRNNTAVFLLLYIIKKHWPMEEPMRY